MPHRLRCKFTLIVFVFVLATGAYFRSSGLFRGLDEGNIYHPDSPKQVMMLFNYLNGNYLQYYDSLFYDGYPYGLNRVDELIIRSVLLPIRPIRDWLSPGRYHDWVPDRGELYYWGRILRVLYGLLTVWLIFATIRKLGGSSLAAMGGASLYAFAPLGATVSHSVTGDIGVDLFLALAMWCLAGYVSGNRTRWILFYGFACGMAFSCKYQGALGGWLAGVLFALLLFRDGKQLRTLIRHGFGIIAAFIVGVMAGTPALMVDPEKAWRSMRKNFEFLKNYGVSNEFLDQPILVKARYGLSHNTPFIMESIGWVFVLLALLSLVWSAYRIIKASTHPDEKRPAALMLAIASFPFMALFLATALKPAVQPFHFTFILPAMAVAVGLLLRDVIGSNHRVGRYLAGAVLLIALGDAVRSSLREDFFWRRTEISGLADDYSRAIFERQSYATKNHTGRRIIKQFYAEPSTLPVFRNRPSGLQHPDATWWLHQHQLPVPSVPIPVFNEWIFINGPVFPRSDRMFVVPASGPGMVGRADDQMHVSKQPLVIVADREDGVWVDRTLVFNQKPQSISFGLRTGRWPARFDLNAPGKKQRIFIPPHSQRIVSIELQEIPVQFNGDSRNPDSYLIPLQFRSQLGPVWVTIVDGPGELAVYSHFGPNPSETDIQNLRMLPTTDLEGHLANLKYMESNGPFSVPMEKIRLPGDAVPLAAGSYLLTADVLNTGTTRRLIMELSDQSGFSPQNIRMDKEVAPGLQRIEWRFTKAFAPYDGAIFVSATAPDVNILNWHLKPDPQGLEHFDKTEAGTDETWPSLNQLNVVYPGLGIVRGIAIPNEVSAATSFPYMVRFDLDENIRHKIFHEAAIFLHLKNREGQIVASLDLPLTKASMSAEIINWQYHSKPMNGIHPGTYFLDGGIYNARTRIRYSFEDPSPIAADKKRDFFRWAELKMHSN